MQPKYEHTQFGGAMLVILLISFFGFLLALILVVRSAPPLPVLVIPAVILGTAFAFQSLTVRVEEHQVVLYFGPGFGRGFARRSFPLEQITGVRVVRNAPWMGIGIHFIRGGMIYNVSGMDAVEITLEDGSLARIGTDEPQALAHAIEEAMRNR